MASSQSFSMIQRRMLLSPWPASPVNSDEPLCTRCDAGTESGVVLHLGDEVGEEHQLAVAAAGDQSSSPGRRRGDDEAGVDDLLAPPKRSWSVFQLLP
jgi:hypothetical protein